MDDADRAGDVEQLYFDIAMRNRHRMQGPQLKKDNIIICTDCGNPIHPKRLVAEPDATRCIDCQGIYERD